LFEKEGMAGVIGLILHIVDEKVCMDMVPESETLRSHAAAGPCIIIWDVLIDSSARQSVRSGFAGGGHCQSEGLELY